MKRSVLLLILLLSFTPTTQARMRAYADYPKNGYVFWLTKNINHHNIICEGHFKHHPDADGNSKVIDRDINLTLSRIGCKSSIQKSFSHPLIKFECPHRYLHYWYGVMWKNGGGVSEDWDINYFRFRQYCPNPPYFFALCGPLENISISEEDFNKNFESYEAFDPISDLGEYKDLYIENTINKFFESLNEAIPYESVNSVSIRNHIDTLDLGKLNSFMYALSGIDFNSEKMESILNSEWIYNLAEEEFLNMVDYVDTRISNETISGRIGKKSMIQNKLESYNITKDIDLLQNYPNPFNPNTAITFRISKPSLVTLSIYNNVSQKIKTLLNEYKSEGRYSCYWNGKNEFNEIVASGVYIYQIKTNDFLKKTKKWYSKNNLLIKSSKGVML